MDGLVSGGSAVASGWIGGEVYLSSILSPSQITSNQNNYAPTGFASCGAMRLTTDAARSITGIAGGASGRTLLVENVGSYNITFTHDATSTAANRFYCPGNANYVLGPGWVCVMNYDATSSRWRITSGGYAPTLDSVTLSTTFPAGASSAGDLGYDTSSKTHRGTDAWTEAAIRKALLPNAAASSAIASTAVQTDFSLTRTIPANALTVGRQFEEWKAFKYSTTGTPTLRLRGYFGSVNYADSGAKTCDTGSSNQTALAALMFSVDSVGASGVIRVSGTIQILGATTLQTVFVNTTVTVDTTASITWKWSATWGTSSASNTITMEHDLGWV